MKKRMLCSLAITSALLFAQPGWASSVSCGMEMIFPDCQAPPSGYQVDPGSQLTFGIGCVGYPGPSDGSLRVNYTTGTVSMAKFTIEADGETLTGGTFTDAGIICQKDCRLDAGISSNCPVSALVRYSGPLIPGKEHKITWTNAANGSLPVPIVRFMVSATSAFDAGLDTVSDTGNTPDSSADASVVMDTGTATTTADSSISTAMAADTATDAPMVDSSISTTLAPDTGTATTTTGTLTSTTVAMDLHADASAATTKRSSSCSCTLGARENASPAAILFVTFLGLVCGPRIASRARTRPRTTAR